MMLRWETCPGGSYWGRNGSSKLRSKRREAQDRGEEFDMGGVSPARLRPCWIRVEFELGFCKLMFTVF